MIFYIIKGTSILKISMSSVGFLKMYKNHFITSIILSYLIKSEIF